jgi:hypothetical protein
MDKAYIAIFDKNELKHDLINFNFHIDKDEAVKFYSPVYKIGEDEVAIAFRGTSLYNLAVEKKKSMSTQDWESYQSEKGKKFVEAAYYGKESENYVLLILETKK